MTDAPKGKPERSATSFAFIPSALDDYGLTAPQFRVWCRISRRGICSESVPNMAKACRLNDDTVWSALSFLCAAGLVKRTARHGNTSLLETTRPPQWQPPTGIKGAPAKTGRPFVSGGTHRNQRGAHPPESRGHKGTPIEGTPLKEGSAADAPKLKQVNGSTGSGKVGFDLNGLVGGLVGKISVRMTTAPTLEEVRTEMEKQFRGAGEFAESFHRIKSLNGWRDRAGQPINHWQPMARSWASGCEKKKRGIRNRR